MKRWVSRREKRRRQRAYERFCRYQNARLREFGRIMVKEFEVYLWRTE
jgi:uncharacterized protein (DUF2384 family)